MIQPDLSALIHDPNYMLFDLRKGPSFLFAGISPRTITHSAFLDHRISPRPERFYSVDVSKVQGVMSELPPPPSLYIGHTSFCCSTLLARCIQSDQLLSLREPRILGVVANEYRRGLSAVEVDPMTAIIFRLLAKTYRSQQQVVIKGTNFTNNLMPALMRLWPQTHLLLMWSDLESFLVSVCKHRDEAQKNLWPFLQAFLIDEGIPTYQHEEWQSMDLLQQAVWTWALQIRQFNRLLLGHGSISPNMMRTLKSSDFLAQPLESVKRVYQMLDLDEQDAALEAQVSKVMSRDSKQLSNETVADLSTQRSAIRVEYTQQIEQALAWAQQQDLQADTTQLVQYAL